MIRRSESHYDGSGGRRLFERRWDPEAPERQLLLVHGYAEHSGRYEHVASWFASRGCAVQAYDHRGHGLSEGVRCHVGRFDEFLDDLDLAVARAHERAPDVPLYVVGHSMGGLVVANWAVSRDPEVAGVVLSAPALGVDDAPSGFARLMLRLMRRLRPTGKAQGDIDPAALSRDPEVGRAYLADPLVVLGMTYSLAGELFGALRRTAPEGARVSLPLLLLHGTDDPLCRHDASEAFARDVPESRFVSYPGLRHEIFNEPEQEQVFADLERWILEREGRATPG